ncbi:MAG: MBL fold metallo-hydrolase [Acidobacteriota bacterium]
MEVLIWGARGSVPNFSKDKIRFGTNTPCVEVRLAGGQRLVFDAGTGIVSLGETAAGESRPDLHLFLTHFHWDHIQGLPFYRGLYDESCRIRVYGKPGIETVFPVQMSEPFSPVPFETLPADVQVQPVVETLELEGASVTPFSLNHPQGCYGYVLEESGAKLVYATDTEPDQGEGDRRLLEAAESADLLIMDTNNSLEEATHRSGWGHSTWRDAASVASKAGVKKLVLFHHDPFHDDAKVLEKENLARDIFPSSFSAYEGMRLRPGSEGR